MSCSMNGNETEIVPLPNAVIYDDGNVKANILIKVSSSIDGVRRGMLANKAESMPADTDEELAYKALAKFAYPQCVTCVEGGTIEIAGKVFSAASIPFELFAILPESLTFFRWLAKVEELNPDLSLTQSAPDPKKN